MIKRLTSVFFVCALLSCFLMIPAKAVVLDGTADWSGGYSDTAASGSFSLSNSVSGSVTYSSFASIIPLLNNISSTTSNIYSLLSTQFSLLISTIQSESDDIQAAINAAVDRMIAYLDGAFSSSVNPALPGTSEDINTGVDSWNQAESGYQSNASERFQSITADFSGFSGDVLSGIGLASTLFQRVWNALGSYVVLYTVPLTLSLCLLVVGRVSRSHSRGGGSSKSKDDGGET